MPRLKTVNELKYKPGQKTNTKIVLTKKQVAESDDGTSLKINLLERELSGFKGYRRNIFKPVFVDEVKISKRQIVTIKRPQAESKQSVVSSVPTQPVIVQPESTPLARFTFLGFLKKGTVKTIFLTKDKDILLVKKGDKVAGRYEATEISDQALTLTVTDTGDEIIIPLIENRPLAAK